MSLFRLISLSLTYTSLNMSLNSFLCLAHHAITIPEHNQEATLYLQELTSALPIQKLIAEQAPRRYQVCLTGNISLVIPLPLSIYN